nr:unnamed protein product [Callosobruchus analis]
MKTLAFILFSVVLIARADYRVGVGRADCTGPAAEIGFMGYAKAAQKGCGIHLRQYSRAYVFDDGTKKAAFVTVDACMMHHGIKKAVLKKLSDRHGDIFTFSNFILSGTHTHSAPGGYLMDVMYDLPNFGFIQETFEALVEGIVRSVERALANMTKAKIYWSTGEVDDANINRSPASYLYNPAEELKKYQNNVDKTLTQMKIVRKDDNKVIGAINWFAVHPTSMNNSNCLVTSDNVGYASILLETSMDPSSLPGKSSFVGAFASTNLGDVSPNTAGPKCINTGLPCEEVRSTCNGEARHCIAFGPGKDMFESTEIIAGKLFQKAKELITTNNDEITGNIGYIHQFVEMANENAAVQLKNGTVVKVKGCKPAMGYAFAAGTTDGPGEFDFHQATNTTNPFWNIVRDFIFPPSPEDVACHAPKPILIMSGAIKLPYEWQPEVVPIQVVKIGSAFLIAVPGELTTMSGRRMREAVRQQIIAEGGPTNTKVVVAGLSNMYSSYVATPEEYQVSMRIMSVSKYTPIQGGPLKRMRRIVGLLKYISEICHSAMVGSLEGYHLKLFLPKFWYLYRVIHTKATFFQMEHPIYCCIFGFLDQLWCDFMYHTCDLK